MKKLASLIIMALLLMVTAVPAFAAVSVSEEVYKGLEDRIGGSFSYYDQGSAEVKDLQSFSTNQVDKEGNVIGEIQLDIMFVEFNEVRDNIFFYTGHELLYYDQTNKQFIDSATIEVTDEIEAFTKSYSDETGKHFNTSSQVLYIILLSSVVIVPVLIMIFHNTGRSYITNFYRGASISK
ncbi:hypothetical protein SAMN05877753_109174 [Bacillus oleivorans]|uniref:Uncharacterized protein n=1 Tax=Bacillus oleivorans TaxID=1448271 RepID=A0A285D3Z8_9BACI|nr:hypothetical protein [Bacillus oleivorans]SNX74547.1 hypothetical protein SAMN05877753_109174 [Bacillus oleivorans]